MSMMIGQKKIVSEINKCSIDTFPRTVLLNGPFGSGKHLLAQYIATKLSLNSCDITNNINMDTIEDINLSNTPTIYTINVSDISIREQNILLKFIEEPPVTAYIILFSERLNAVLDTVKNRCHVIQLETYTDEELKSFAASNDINNEQVINISRTPGEILYFNTYSFQLAEITDYCKKIFDNITIASPSNVLVISNKISYKETDNKYNPKCFFRTLRDVSYKYVLNNNQIKYYKAYLLTEKLCENIEVPHINLQYLFENYLMSLKEVLSDK